MSRKYDVFNDGGMNDQIVHVFRAEVNRSLRGLRTLETPESSIGSCPSPRHGCTRRRLQSQVTWRMFNGDTAYSGVSYT